MVPSLTQAVTDGGIVLQSGGGGGGIAGLLLLLVYLAIIVVVVAGMWKMFEKAGQPGWGAIIPIYNTYLLIKIAGRPVWWLLLFLIPVVNFIIGIVVHIDIADKFGKDTVYGIAMAIVPFIFYPLLGFGDAQYQSA